ncbi:DivIVA domain-containing protein [Deinococcus sp. YIM 77859]|uniref:DivIVA domain-containing protein n=1 Tax=Deinococcus sp. YIM 77859 TaxID=1540221 RepID=UPI000689F42C|nr:DivIVA domain-containing protein [Deinococcus sp. YIM 77859]
MSQHMNPHKHEPLTPLDISQRQFPGRPGGYDRAGVRAFLEQVADQVEALLHERQALLARVEDLERELEERRQAEDEIRRAVVAAERIGHDLRENAARQCELLLSQAQQRREALDREAEARQAELEASHQARMQELEAAFRGRFADLESEYHQLTLERDRAHAERTVYLERAFHERHAELTARLSAVRTEYTQFVSQYRALVQSFAELSARHLPAEEDLSLPATTLPGRPASLALDVPLAGEDSNGLARRDEQSFA